MSNGELGIERSFESYKNQTKTMLMNTIAKAGPYQVLVVIALGSTISSIKVNQETKKTTQPTRMELRTLTPNYCIHPHLRAAHASDSKRSSGQGPGAMLR